MSPQVQNGTCGDICRMESFARELDYLYSQLAIYLLYTHCVTLLHIFKILPNVRSTNMVKKLIQVCKDREWALNSKNKILLPLCFSISNFFDFHHSNLSDFSLCFSVSNIKSLCNAKFTIDATSFFAFFVLIFMSAHGGFSIFQQLGEFK